jgi:HK97 family phage major capsid protein
MKLKDIHNRLQDIEVELAEIKAKADEGTAEPADVENAQALMSEEKNLKAQLETFEAMDTRAAAKEAAPSHIQVMGPAAENAKYPFGDFAKEVFMYEKNKIMPKRLEAQQKKMNDMYAATGLSEGVPSDGGFMLNPEYSSEILSNMYDQSAVLSRVRRRTLSPQSNSIKIPYVDETDRGDGTRLGGIRAYWANEAAQMTGSTPKFGEITLTPNKLTGLCYVTDELLSDASMLGGFLEDGFRDEFDFKIADGIVNGDGAGKPLGILNANALISVSKETGQDASTFVFENATNMYARLWARSRPNAVWLMSQDVIPQLLEMNIAVGTGGVPAFVPAGGVTDTPVDRLWGMPILYIEQCQSVGTKGDVYLADLSQYLLVEKGGLQGATSIHLRFDYNETAFRWTYRVDGQPIWQSALTPFNDGDTVSPYIALAARS